jgi:hypothetical protein
MNKSVDEWTPKEVGEWLSKNGFEEYVTLFRDEHKIDGKCLLIFSEEDLRCAPLLMKVLGDIKRLSIAIRLLQQSNSRLVYNLISPPISIASLDHQLTHHSNSLLYDRYTNHRSNNDTNNDDFNSNESVEDQKQLRPESWKALIAMLYFFCATWITAIVMVIVHDRVPDMQTYPPLPDIFLDNIPLISWAFSMCEICGLVLFIIWSFILIFHKHRFVCVKLLSKLLIF